jgi:hypothetical protein
VGNSLGDKEYEIEDLMPSQKMVETVDRTFRGRTYFDENYKIGEPIVDQIQAWAIDNNIALDKTGWKVDLARIVINQFDRVMKNVPADLEQNWEKLFSVFVK